MLPLKKMSGKIISKEILNFLWKFGISFVSLYYNNSLIKIQKIMEATIVICNNCNWQGEEDELEVFEDTTEVIESIDRCFFKGCPNCETDDFLMDI